jgi:thiamine-phosphate diphosphorylase
VDRVQIRERTLEGVAWLAFAEEIADAARGERPDVEVVVNRRVDVARMIAADGVHLGFDGMAPADARALLGPAALIGVSTHAPGEAARALRAGAGYVHLAPIFPPLSKRSERPPLGIAAVESSAGMAGGPVIAQGGIEAGHVPALVAAGAAGIAVTGALLAADDPERAAAALRKALDDAARTRDGA